MPVNSTPDIHEQVICANMFIRKGDKYLVLRRSPEKKYLPNVIHPIGGKVELDENPFDAAVREVREEAGVEVKNVILEAVILEIKPYKDDPHNWLIYHFSSDYDKGKIKDTEEGKLVWLSPQQIKKEELFPSLNLIIGHILNPKTGTVFVTSYWDSNNQTIVRHTIDICAK